MSIRQEPPAGYWTNTRMKRDFLVASAGTRSIPDIIFSTFSDAAALGMKHTCAMRDFPSVRLQVVQPMISTNARISTAKCSSSFIAMEVS
jgi:hypothetical protein